MKEHDPTLVPTVSVKDLLTYLQGLPKEHEEFSVMFGDEKSEALYNISATGLAKGPKQEFYMLIGEKTQSIAEGLNSDDEIV